jgi:hypothetical protein
MGNYKLNINYYIKSYLLEYLDRESLPAIDISSPKFAHKMIL